MVALDSQRQSLEARERTLTSDLKRKNKGPSDFSCGPDRTLLDLDLRLERFNCIFSKKNDAKFPKNVEMPQKKTSKRCGREMAAKQAAGITF